MSDFGQRYDLPAEIDHFVDDGFLEMLPLERIVGVQIGGCLHTAIRDDADRYFGRALDTASLFIAGPVPEVLPATSPGDLRSVFQLDSGECCMRWCGCPAAVTAGLVKSALSLAGKWTVGPEAPPWLLASGGLPPNHWF
jgi:hypothetical protein